MCKGIILAGGAGTRLHPITKGISKQLLPIYDKPMIYYPISTLMLADIKDILIITTPEEQQLFKRLLGDGSDFGVHFEYAVQDKPNGIAEAFIIGEEFIGNDSVCLILGDNIFHGPGISRKLSLAASIIEDKANPRAVVFGYAVSDARRYGVAEVVKNNKFGDLYSVVSIEEKPQEPKSNIAVTGLYFYPNSVIDVAKSITPSARGELEITEVNRRYNETIANDGGTMLDLIMFDRGYAWLDTGTFESLSEASNYIETIENRQGLKVACLEEIAYRKGWISKEKVLEIGNSMAKNDYGQYLINLVK
jgi:glucose-1-phosphate thymidylyltransferase